MFFKGSTTLVFEYTDLTILAREVSNSNFIPESELPERIAAAPITSLRCKQVHTYDHWAKPFATWFEANSSDPTR
jgi:hypothetical protein